MNYTVLCADTDTMLLEKGTCGDSMLSRRFSNKQKNWSKSQVDLKGQRKTQDNHHFPKSESLRKVEK